MQSVVADLAEVAGASGSRGSAASRLVTALAGGATTDARPLVRQVLAQLSHQVPGTWLDLGPEPDAKDWDGDGILTRMSRDGRLQVALGDNWRPRWNVLGDLDGIARAATAPAEPNGRGSLGTLARRFEHVELDPFLRGIPGIDSYRGAAQREAVLAAVRCPPGGVLHVILPTGTGKSLVGLARGLTDRRGTTIVVVPTVALALDQERKALGSPLAEILGLPDRLAYTGDLSPVLKQGILDRVAAGSQRLLFTSPEALINGRLASRVHQLAAQGGLSALVIDEAHLVATWGESFRPVFQILPALRNGLIDAARAGGHHSPATITMTGTLTTHGLATLERLFAGQPTAVVGGAWLRPEPQFLTAQFRSPDQRDRAVVEALAHLPRPAIVYVSLRERTEELAATIRAAGYTRVATFHGDTDPAARRMVLEGWSGDGENPTRFDVVVANSAFGLGIDVPNVRTIIHACIPETFDRFYQEVGRAGRDGHTAVSLLLHAPGDADEAAGLRTPKPITPKVAWPRLLAMLRDSEIVDGSWHTVEVARRVDGGTPTETDVRWNVHILATMLQAGMIDLRTRPLPPKEDAPDGSPDSMSGTPPVVPHPGFPIGRVNVQFHLRWRDVALGSEDDWERAVGPYRDAIREAATLSGSAVTRVVHAKACVAETAREQYRLTTASGEVPIDWRPVGACNGCPDCGQVPPRGPSVAAGFSQELDVLLQTIPRICDTSGSRPADLLVLCMTSRDVRRTIQRLVEFGFLQVVGLRLPLDDAAWQATLRAAPAGWVMTQPSRRRPGIPAVIVLPDRFDPELLRVDRAGTVLIAGPDTTATNAKFPLVQQRAWVPPTDFLREIMACRS